MRIHQLLATIKEASRQKGVFYVIKKGLYIWLYLIYYKVFCKGRSFTFRGKKYHYFYDIINNTWMNERSVEVAIIMDILNKNKVNKILEVGNVLSNYYRLSHDVVDKYEKAPNVINQDIVDFKSDFKYDIIVSISTLEHVGWDEKPRDDEKIPRALENLRSLLKPKGGMMIVTLPLGYNEALNTHLNNRTIRFQEQYYLLRTGSNSWRQATWDEVKKTRFGNPYPGANGLVVGIDYG
ncbi:MAG: hypothetical protein QW177_08425 [Candidatus Nitrosotenuis sp.]